MFEEASRQPNADALCRQQAVDQGLDPIPIRLARLPFPLQLSVRFGFDGRRVDFAPPAAVASGRIHQLTEQCRRVESFVFLAKIIPFALRAFGSLAPVLRFVPQPLVFATALPPLLAE